MPLLGGPKAVKTGDGHNAASESSSQPPASGKTDLLLRFFDSQFFDEWIALTYLYKSTSQGVQDYLCNRLYTLPEKGLERYLSQLCQLIINRPHSSLERVIVDLCARSLRIAVKVYWLLLAISQDQPRNAYVAELRDQCERAALEGYWEPPFRDPKLLPMSPPRARWLVGSPNSPAVSNGAAGTKFRNPLSISQRFGSPEPFVSPPRARPGDPERPTSPDGLGGGIYSSYSMGQGLEGLICASPSAVRAAARGERQLEVFSPEVKQLSMDRRRKLRVELGDGEQVTALLDNSHKTADGALRSGSGMLVSPRSFSSQPGDPTGFGRELSPPSSPRLRQTTFGATLDFIEALCDASSGLTAFAPEDRQWALRKGLEEINKEIEHASRMGVACWFPMGTRNERIVRLAAREAVLLNSREKAPFMLIVEVLSAEGDEDDVSSPVPGPEEHADHKPVGRSLQERSDSHASAGPGPGSEKGSSPREVPQQSVGVGFNQGSARGTSPQRRLKVLSPGNRPSPQSASSSWRTKAKELAITPKAYPSPDNSFSSGLKAAMAGLQGSGPLVSVSLEVLNAQNDYLPTASEHSTSSTASSYIASPANSSHDLPGHAKPLRGASSRTVGVIHEDDDMAFSPPRGMGLLCTWAVCRAKGDQCDKHHWRMSEPYVKVHLKVHGGVDLRLSTKQHASHRRVPSDEAILRMAAQQRVPPPDPRDLAPAGSAPLPETNGTSGPAAPNESAKNGEDIAAASPNAETGPPEPLSPASTALKRQAEASAVFGERFKEKRARLQKDSPHGKRPGWAARPIIVKSGDDCRQELLAAQLIDAFYDIFQEAQLPLYLRPYEVLVTSNRTALIEMVPDSLSLHQLKARSPPGSSLAEEFFAKFVKGTPQCEEAQRNFAESMAAYSIVCYLLQIKDRHNGNILLDDEGHIIHIDFGFMLSNSPGGVNFEAAPFKLTRELLEVLDSNAEGRASETFDYYKVLCIQGFLACRKHADRIILLVEMMLNSGCPCLKGGPRAVTALRKRFQLTLPESQCVEVVLSLISDSVDAWRTRQYDMYQRVLNNIL